MKGTAVISSVTLTTIVVRDFEAALDFYVNTLGLERFPNETSVRAMGVRVSPPAGAGIVIALRTDDRNVANKHDTTRLMEDTSQMSTKRLSKRDFQPRRPRIYPEDRAVLALRTDDIFAEYRKLRERGVHFIRKPVRGDEAPYFGAPDGAPEEIDHRLIWAAFFDQDQNIIRLEQKLEKGDPGPIELVRATERI